MLFTDTGTNKYLVAIYESSDKATVLEWDGELFPGPTLKTTGSLLSVLAQTAGANENQEIKIPASSPHVAYVRNDNEIVKLMLTVPTPLAWF